MKSYFTTFIKDELKELGLFYSILCFILIPASLSLLLAEKTGISLSLSKDAFLVGGIVNAIVCLLTGKYKIQNSSNMYINARVEKMLVILKGGITSHLLLLIVGMFSIFILNVFQNVYLLNLLTLFVAVNIFLYSFILLKRLLFLEKYVSRSINS